MDFITKMMNKIIPHMSLTLLHIVLPIYFFFKFILATLRPFFSEDLLGKVVIITGASSGIGERMAYDYASRGARLALVARREGRLQSVASIATLLGCKDVITIKADVSKLEDCRRFVNQTINYYGRLDHLVNNAGVSPVFMFGETPDLTKFVSAMDINFWGSVYSTYFAIPYLKRTKGKIIVISSAATWLPVPQLGLYSATKAAVTSFYETLRVEIGREVGITIVTPGLTESEMTQGKFLTQSGTLELDQEMRDVVMSMTPMMPAKDTAKAIVTSGSEGAYYLTVPTWVRYLYYWHVFVPEVLEWSNRLLMMPRPGSTDTDTLSRKIVDALAGFRPCLQPGIVEYPEIGDNGNMPYSHY